jgi:hypothetical protein
MYGFHPETVHMQAMENQAEMRRAAERRRRRTRSVPLRHWLGSVFVR